MDREQFAAYLVLQGLADSTVKVYLSLWSRWSAWAVTAGRDPQRPDPLAVRAWATTLPGTASTRAQAKATMKHACEALAVEDCSTAVPVPRQPRRLSRALEPAQAAALAAEAHRQGLAGLAVLVGLYTAARRSEIASLAWPRIDLQGRTVTLARPKTRDLHRVPLHPVLGEALAEVRVPGETWVFPGRWEGHVAPAVIWEWTLQVAEAAGIGRVTPHQLRHTALTLANDTTRDLRAVQDLAGHVNPAVTARYTRASTDAMRAAVSALDYTSATSGGA